MSKKRILYTTNRIRRCLHKNICVTVVVVLADNNRLNIATVTDLTGPWCYSCNKTLSDYHLCDNTVLCQIDEVCMRRELRSIVDGHEEFELTCATKSFCDDPWRGLSMFGKRVIKPRDVAVSCCTTDLCNIPELTTVSHTTAKPTTVAKTTTAATTTKLTKPTATTASPQTTRKPAIATTITPPGTVSTRSPPPTTTTSTTPRSTTTPAHCTGRCCKDFMIAVDESRSIHPYTMKQFLHHVVSNLQIGSTKTLVSLGTFDQQSRTVFNIGDHMTKYSTLAAIDSATFHGGNGDINAGVDYLIHHATTPSGGDRPGYPNILLIITDGTSSQISTSKESVLHSKAEHVISVEIGIHYKTLASSQQYQVQIHDQNYLQNVYQKVSDLVCNEPSSHYSSNQGFFNTDFWQGLNVGK